MCVGVKARRSKSDSEPIALEEMKPVIPPSPSLSTSQPTPGSVGSIPQPTNTPSPSQITELTTATLTTDKSPLAKASSAGSLAETYPWIHSNSPKVSSNPASVESTVMSSFGLPHSVGEAPPISISHSLSPQSALSPQRTSVTTSLHPSSSYFSSSSSSSSSQPHSQPFPLQSNMLGPGASSFPGTLSLSAHDPLGSFSNPIQITSPGADPGSLSFQTSSAAASSHSLASLMSSASSLSSVTSPPFGFSSSLSSSMASQIDIASVASTLEPQSASSTLSNISSLLMATSSSTAPLSSSPSIRPPPPPLPSQTPTPPPPSGTQSQGAAAVAAQILRQAVMQAKNPQSGGMGSTLQAPNVSNGGFSQSTSSVAPGLSQPVMGRSLDTMVTGQGGAGIAGPLQAPVIPMQVHNIVLGY